MDYEAIEVFPVKTMKDKLFLALSGWLWIYLRFNDLFEAILSEHLVRLLFLLYNVANVDLFSLGWKLQYKWGRASPVFF